MPTARPKKIQPPPPELVATVTEDEGGCLHGYQVGSTETGTWVPLVVAAPVYLSFDGAAQAARQALERAHAALWKRYRKNAALSRSPSGSAGTDPGPGAA